VNRTHLVAIALLAATATVAPACAQSDDGDTDSVDTEVTVDAPDQDPVRDDPRDPRSGRYQGPQLESPGDTAPPSDDSVPPL
jgi:hypothetical protein